MNFILYSDIIKTKHKLFGTCSTRTIPVFLLGPIDGIRQGFITQVLVKSFGFFFFQFSDRPKWPVWIRFLTSGIFALGREIVKSLFQLPGCVTNALVLVMATTKTKAAPAMKRCAYDCLVASRKGAERVTAHLNSPRALQHLRAFLLLIGPDPMPLQMVFCSAERALVVPADWKTIPHRHFSWSVPFPRVQFAERQTRTMMTARRRPWSTTTLTTPRRRAWRRAYMKARSQLEVG